MCERDDGAVEGQSVEITASGEGQSFTNTHRNDPLSTCPERKRTGDPGAPSEGRRPKCSEGSVAARSVSYLPVSGSGSRTSFPVRPV